MRYEGCCICLIILKLACNEECCSRPGDFCKINECAECLSSQLAVVLFWESLCVAENGWHDFSRTSTVLCRK